MNQASQLANQLASTQPARGEVNSEPAGTPPPPSSFQTSATEPWGGGWGSVASVRKELGEGGYQPVRY